MELQKRIELFWDAVKAKEIEGIRSAYIPSESTYVILEGPRFSTMGTTAIFKGWQDFLSSKIQMNDYKWVEGPFEEIEGSFGWIGGITDLSLDVEGKIFSNRFRISFVMKHYEGDWKIRHEHVSAPMEDPYGVGDIRHQTSDIRHQTSNIKHLTSNIKHPNLYSITCPNL